MPEHNIDTTHVENDIVSSDYNMVIVFLILSLELAKLLNHIADF